MPFERDRIDGRPALPLLRSENARLHEDDEAWIELPLSATLDVGVHFPAPGGLIEPRWLELAADVLANLTTMDNEVQRVCAKVWAGSGYPSSYYEGELAYITLTGAREAVLRYFAIGCNSEWDERFVRAGGRWVRAADAEPGAAADGGAR